MARRREVELFRGSQGKDRDESLDQPSGLSSHYRPFFCLRLQLRRLPQVYPLYMAIGGGCVLVSSFMFKYFAGHTDIHLSRKARMDHEVSTLPGRVNWHNSHCGLMDMSHKSFRFFGFNWQSKEGAGGPRE